MWGLDGSRRRRPPRSFGLRTPAVRNGLLASLVVLATLAPLGAEEAALEKRHRPLEIGPFAGFVLPDDHLTVTKDPGLEPTLGLHLGRPFNRRLRWFAEAQMAQFDSQSLRGDADMLAARGGVELLVAPGRRLEPFVTASWGYMRMTFDNPNATDFESAVASAGLGQHIQVGERMRVRWEARFERTMARDGLAGQDLTQAVATVGVNWVLGKKALDADGDGVAGHRDRCRDTPTGLTVDYRGCPHDSDGDGVYDGLDMCPATPEGWAVGAAGCPPDSDGDGVADAVDSCAATAQGAVVDAQGCALDGDGDGVVDGFDRCPNTLRGIEVDERGCFLDADEDGVYDGLGMDRCPGTPKGTTVDPFGCPLKDDNRP